MAIQNVRVGPKPNWMQYAGAALQQYLGQEQAQEAEKREQEMALERIYAQEESKKNVEAYKGEQEAIARRQKEEADKVAAAAEEAKRQEALRALGLGGPPQPQPPAAAGGVPAPQQNTVPQPGVSGSYIQSLLALQTLFGKDFSKPQILDAALAGQFGPEVQEHAAKVALKVEPDANTALTQRTSAANNVRTTTTSAENNQRTNERLSSSASGKAADPKSKQAAEFSRQLTSLSNAEKRLLQDLAAAQAALVEDDNDKNKARVKGVEAKLGQVRAQMDRITAQAKSMGMRGGVVQSRAQGAAPQAAPNQAPPTSQPQIIEYDESGNRIS